MGLYNNYIRDDIVMSYSKFKKIEGKQKALQDQYEDYAECGVDNYNLYDPNLHHLITGDTIGDLIYNTWKESIYSDLLSVFYDFICLIEKELHNSFESAEVAKMDIVGKFLRYFSTSFVEMVSKLEKLGAKDYCDNLDKLISYLGIEEDDSYFYVPDPLSMFLGADKDGIKCVAEEIYNKQLKVGR